MAGAPLRTVAALFAVTLLAAFLRFHELGAKSLWADEILTFDTISRDAVDIPRASLLQNNCTPLYFLLVRLATICLGESEEALRLLSVLSGVLTVPLFFVLMRELAFTPAYAVLGGVLLALNPLHIWFSQEARPYALLTLFACAAFVFLARAIRTGSRLHWAGLGASVISAFLTHPVGLVLVPTAWVWVLSAFRRKGSLRYLLTLSLIVMVIASLFALTLWAHGSQPPPPRQSTGFEIPYTVFSFVAGYSFGPSPREIQGMGAMGAVATNLLQTSVVALLIAGICATILFRSRSADLSPAAAFGIPVFMLAAASFLTTFPYNVRYVLPALLGFLALVVGAAQRLPRPYRQALICGVLLVFTWSDVQWFTSYRYGKEDTRAVSTWLAGHLSAGGVVGVAPDYMTGVLEYYLTKQHPAKLIRILGQERLAEMGIQPDALVITRTHHVPDADRLEHAFLSSTGQKILRGSATGYSFLAIREP